MATELAGPDPGPGRRLCIEAVLFAWLDHWHVSTLMAVKGNQRLTVDPHWVRRQQGAHRRLMASLKTLAQITALEERTRGRSAIPEALTP
jgi:hypothetical protein